MKKKRTIKIIEFKVPPIYVLDLIDPLEKFIKSKPKPIKRRRK